MGDETPEPLADHQQEILDDNSSDSYKGRTDDTEAFTPPPVRASSSAPMSRSSSAKQAGVPLSLSRRSSDSSTGTAGISGRSPARRASSDRRANFSRRSFDSSGNLRSPSHSFSSSFDDSYLDGDEAEVDDDGDDDSSLSSLYSDEEREFTTALFEESSKMRILNQMKEKLRCEEEHLMKQYEMEAMKMTHAAEMELARSMSELARKRAQIESEEAFLRAERLRLALKDDAYFKRKEMAMARKRAVANFKEAQRAESRAKRKADSQKLALVQEEDSAARIASRRKAEEEAAFARRKAEQDKREADRIRRAALKEAEEAKRLLEMSKREIEKLQEETERIKRQAAEEAEQAKIKAEAIKRDSVIMQKKTQKEIEEQRREVELLDMQTEAQRRKMMNEMESIKREAERAQRKAAEEAERARKAAEQAALIAKQEEIARRHAEAAKKKAAEELEAARLEALRIKADKERRERELAELERIKSLNLTSPSSPQTQRAAQSQRRSMGTSSPRKMLARGQMSLDIPLELDPLLQDRPKALEDSKSIVTTPPTSATPPPREFSDTTTSVELDPFVLIEAHAAQINEAALEQHREVLERIKQLTKPNKTLRLVKDYQHKMQKFGFTVAGIDSPLGQITYVNSIDEQSVAQAQLKMGDVILAINFQDFFTTNRTEIATTIAAAEKVGNVSLGLWRDPTGAFMAAVDYFAQHPEAALVLKPSSACGFGKQMSLAESLSTTTRSPSSGTDAASRPLSGFKRSHTASAATSASSSPRTSGSAPSSSAAAPKPSLKGTATTMLAMSRLKSLNTN